MTHFHVKRVAYNEATDTAKGAIYESALRGGMYNIGDVTTRLYVDTAAGRVMTTDSHEDALAWASASGFGLGIDLIEALWSSGRLIVAWLR